MKPTKMERPRNRPSDFINFHVRCDSRLVETLPLAKCLYHGGVFWHFVSIKIYDFSCFSAVVVQSMLSTLSKKIRFLNRFAFRHSASESFPSLQLADRLCNLARQATWQHLFTSLPVPICCTSMGKHLRAASLDTAHGLFKLALGVVHSLMCTT